MVGELVPSPVGPVTVGADFWRRYQEFRGVRQKETRPDEPVRNDADEEAHLKRISPFQAEKYFEVFQGREMLGLLQMSFVEPAAPAYESNQHLCEADVFVRGADRRHGIASSFLPVIVELMDVRGCTTVGGWVEEGARRSPDTRLETIIGPVPEEEWEAFGSQLSVMLNTMPFEALDHGKIVVTPETMRDFYKRLEVNREVQHTVLTREPDGTISGITDVTWAPHRSEFIEQRFTGVRPDARGRGLGKWIKASMLLHLRELYPDTRWIGTGNAGSNAPMLKINRALGFKPYRTGTAYQITRDRLAARLAAG